MKIALIPLNPTVGAIHENTEKILSFIDKAIEKQCSLIIFPEMSLIGYPPKDYLFYPFLLENQNKSLIKLKRRSKKIAIIVGGINKNKGIGRPFYNQALVFYNGQKYTYNKQLLPNYDVFDDWRYFTPGTEPLVLKIGGKKFGISICEDIWSHDENIKIKYIRDPLIAYRKKNLDYLINISASPYETEKSHRRHKLLKNVCKEVNCPVIYVNQTGANDDLIFDGTALVYNKAGEPIFETPPFIEKLFVFDTSKRKKLPSQKKSADEKYNMLEKALITGIRDYVHKSGFNHVVLGLSGGVDSALVAYLAAKALGPKNVTGVMMPSRYSSKESVSDSKALAKNTGIKIRDVNIESLHRQFDKTFKKIFSKDINDITEQNIQARIRGNLLMAFSNNTNSLLLNTTNKSEMAMGYGTLYGDMCGALSVLSDVTKTQVYELCDFINRNETVIPKNILNKPPSAELKPNQKDSDTLPPYDVLDPQIENLVNEYGADMATDPELSASTLRAITRNEYKRSQAALGLKISSKAFGIGRRIPIVVKMEM